MALQAVYPSTRGCSPFAGGREQVSCVVLRAPKGLESIAQGLPWETTPIEVRPEGAPDRMS
jgi:hypothetical protein